MASLFLDRQETQKYHFINAIYTVIFRITFKYTIICRFCKNFCRIFTTFIHFVQTNQSNKYAVKIFKDSGIPIIKVMCHLCTNNQFSCSNVLIQVFLLIENCKDFVSQLGIVIYLNQHKIQFLSVENN
ncbi:Protein of unknown function [Gryllus bimaculatus]|nr:Protein of unknown function [Gryllus bimaculatus]